MVEKLKTEDVLLIHDHLTSWFSESNDPISPPGVKNFSLLDSAVSRPYQSAGGSDSYEKIFDKAASLFHSIINNHPFHNGNKRTALVTSCVFLDRYGYWLECPDEDLYNFTTDTAAHRLVSNRNDEISFISSWFEDKSRRINKSDKPLKFRALREILISFGFEVDPPDSEIIRICKDGEMKTKIIKKGISGAEDYDPPYISGLRKKLNLTTDYGVDSNAFYANSVVDDFISEIIKLRSEVIRKLAET